jgi:hypothetical protein
MWISVATLAGGLAVDQAAWLIRPPTGGARLLASAGGPLVEGRGGGVRVWPQQPRRSGGLSHSG